MGRRKDQAQFNMRLSRPLLKQLQNAAKDQDRSLNSEMVHRLEHSFESGDQLTRLTEMVSQLLKMSQGWAALYSSERSLREGIAPRRTVAEIMSDLALRADADLDAGGVINLIDAIRQRLGREPTIEELHAARRRALQVESSDNEPELPMPQPRKIGG
jgi:hypothetical protein